MDMKNSLDPTYPDKYTSVEFISFRWGGDFTKTPRKLFFIENNQNNICHGWYYNKTLNTFDCYFYGSKNNFNGPSIIRPRCNGLSDLNSIYYINGSRICGDRHTDIYYNRDKSTDILHMYKMYKIYLNYFEDREQIDTYNDKINKVHEYVIKRL
jgi:hypothetical protein